MDSALPDSQLDSFPATMLTKPLNDDFQFDQLPLAQRNEVLSAFRGPPRKETFVVNAAFYRFVTTQKGTQPDQRGNAVLDAAWWFGETTRSQLAQLAHRQKTSLGASARVGLAVPKAFNQQMEYLCKVRVTAPVCGWVGQARWQQCKTTKVYFPGGAEQVYFPTVAISPNGLSSAVLRIETWAYLDDI